MSLVPQFGFFELMVIGLAALIIVGPKDLPRLMRGFGRFVAKAKSLAYEFQASFDQMARETEIAEMRKEIEELRRANPLSEAKREIEAATADVDGAVRDESLEVQDAMSRPRSAKAANEPDESGR